MNCNKCYVKHGWIGDVWPIIIKVFSTVLMWIYEEWECVKFQEKIFLMKIEWTIPVFILCIIVQMCECHRHTIQPEMFKEGVVSPQKMFLNFTGPLTRNANGRRRDCDKNGQQN